MPNQPTDSVRFRPDIEPYVQLMERTPREACVPTVVEQLRRGLTYRQFLEALMLAGIRKSNSGHEVYLVHAAHQMSLDARHEDRLLPLFWALDSFKRQQEALPAPPISSLKGNLPPQEKAPREFHDAIRQFDRERSELAIIALARSRGPEHAIQHLWHYGARDWDSIGHHAIALANCFRTLQAINWKHAEPVLRFVIRHLVGRPENQSYYPNVSRAKRGFEKLEHAWDHAGSAPEATLELFAVMREGEVDEACELASGLLIGNRATAGAIWDAVHLTAGDLMVRFNDESRLCTRPLHANTSANALHYSFRNSNDDETRLLILLQAVGWIAEFTRVEKFRGNLRDLNITQLPSVETPQSQEAAVEEIFALLSSDAKFPKGSEMGGNPANRAGQDKAMPKALTLSQRHPNPQIFFEEARRLLFRKATYNAHNYKFPAAIFEDYELVNPKWRPHILATSVNWLYGCQSPYSPVYLQVSDSLNEL